MMCSNSRYALYYAPAQDSDLHVFGVSWIGRNAYLDEPVDQITLPNVSDTEIKNATEFPRHYGFHGTLKAPFRLADGCTEGQLIRSAASFAARQTSFYLPSLNIAVIGDFIALVPEAACPELNLLADACVREFDRFRAPLSEEEINRRMSAGLTARQIEYLKKWGYPYVMDEFRFHLTLTGHIRNARQRIRFINALTPMVKPFTQHALVVNTLTLFYQKDRKTPFRIIQSFPFGQHPASLKV